jgi:eukaryotic-like serine/threonine-protein kinase
MTIDTGTRLGRYEIRSKLGAGGMGEVYVARDTEIFRDVAVKVLPSMFSADRDRLHRFQQEACAAGALNHPNILSIYDVGKHEGSLYVVSELLEGETLRQRIAGTPLAQRRAIEYALQISHGLAAAHEKGIIHRDLKPDNIFITNDGRAKILDFGLAKLTQPDVDQVQTDIPTRRVDTDPGVVMGTVGYMSPEQVRGRAVDQRSDIFSFGAILYEMLSGSRAFQGESVADTMSAILREDPPELSQTATDINPALERLVNHCLEKNPQERFHSARDLGFALEALSGGPSGQTAATTIASRPAPVKKERWIWVAVTALLLIATTIALSFALFRKVPTETRIVRYNITLPDKTSAYADVETHNIAISPDGRHLAFIAIKNNKQELWLQAVSELSPQPIPGTDGAYSPFWSPDSRHVGFFAQGTLKRLDISTSSIQTVCKLSAEIETVGTWGSDGVILFNDQFNDPAGSAATLPTQSSSAIYRVQANGGSATVLTKSPRFKPAWVHFLPDGKHFLFYGRAEQPEENGIYAASVDSPEGDLILKTAPTRVEYSAPGYLLFAREGSVLAQPFDEQTLRITGDAVTVANRLPFFDKTGWAEFSVSANGILACATMNTNRRLVWIDRSGREVGQVGNSAGYYEVRLSPDDQFVAISIADERIGSADIWVHDLKRDTRVRFAFGPTDDGNATWSPDGKRLAYFSCCEGSATLLVKDLTDPGKGQPVLPTGFRSPWDWSRDGKFILFSENDPNTTRDIWVAPLDGQKPYPLLQTQFNESYAQFSPNGRWVAYLSNETGNNELYVARFDNPREKRRVSTSGASQPRWRDDGKELFYLSADNNLMVVPVKEGDAFDPGEPSALFKFETIADVYFDVNSKGDRFLMFATDPIARATAFTMVLNWTSDLKK